MGDAYHAAFLYLTPFLFKSYVYNGLKTGSKDVVSYILKQNKIRIVLRTSLQTKYVINDHINSVDIDVNVNM